MSTKYATGWPLLALCLALIVVPPVLAGEHSPDPNRLLRARMLIGVDTEPSNVGPYTLYTDVDDSYLLNRFAEIAENLPAAYRERFGVDPGPAAGEVVVLYQDEELYRTFEAGEPAVAQASTDGYATRGLIVLYVGDQDDFILDVLFVHELTHLLNRRALSLGLPAWLDEGLATELAISRLDPVTLEVQLGTLNGDDLYQPAAMLYAQGLVADPVRGQPLGNPANGYRDLKGGVAALTELGLLWDLPGRPGLEELVTMSSREFIEPGRRGLNYALSAFMIRYFLDSGRKNRERLLRYLQIAAEQGVLPAPSPWAFMDKREKKVENRLRVWVRDQLFSERVMYAYDAMLTGPVRTTRGYSGGYAGRAAAAPSGGAGASTSGLGGGSTGSAVAGSSRGTGVAPPTPKSQVKN